jgi:hypothetical protein
MLSPLAWRCSPSADQPDRLFALGEHYHEEPTSVGLPKQHEALFVCRVAGIVDQLTMGITKYQSGARVAVSREEGLQQRAELLIGQAGVADDAAHGERVDGIVSRNGDDPDAVGHHDVLALPDDTKAGFLKGPDGVLMVDARNARPVLRGDLDFANDGPFEKGITGGQVSLDRLLDVLERFLLRGALRPAARQSRDRHTVPLIGLE